MTTSFRSNEYEIIDLHEKLFIICFKVHLTKKKENFYILTKGFSLLGGDIQLSTNLFACQVVSLAWIARKE